MSFHVILHLISNNIHNQNLLKCEFAYVTTRRSYTQSAKHTTFWYFPCSLYEINAIFKSIFKDAIVATI